MLAVAEGFYVVCTHGERLWRAAPDRDLRMILVEYRNRFNRLFMGVSLNFMTQHPGGEFFWLTL
jgi:hypothetical protein